MLPETTGCWVQCTNCQSYNTQTHYEHVAGGITHPVDIPNNPPPPPDPKPVSVPVDVECPVEGNPKIRAPLVHYLCSDCGRIFF